MKKLRIAMIGREAARYLAAFSDQECRVVADLSQIDRTDDLVFCLSYPHIVAEHILALPKHGVWVNHSSDLPKGRGWAPLQWSVLAGLPEVTVTLFRATAGCDEGPWAFKQSFAIEKTDTIETLYAKDYEVSSRLYRRLIEAVLSGSLVLHEQVGQPSYWRRRTPADSRLDATKPLEALWDHIRVCHNEDYPAFFLTDGHKITLRYEVQKVSEQDDKHAADSA